MSELRISPGATLFGAAFASVLLAAVIAPVPAAAQDTPEIGTAVLVKRTVTAKLGEDSRVLRANARVRRTELLETGAEASAELRLDDETKLALGPNASLKLDDFVIGRSEGVTTIGVNFVKGTFRFLTGSQDSKSYRIQTPSATIGVRGTVFDVYVAGNGETLVLLHEGEVDVCNKSRACQRHNTRGRIVRAGIDGVISTPVKFVTGMIPGLSVGRAFPFIGRTLRIDPVRRLRAADLVERPARGAVQAIEQGAGAVGRTIRRGLPF